MLLAAGVAPADPNNPPPTLVPPAAGAAPENRPVVGVAPNRLEEKGPPPPELVVVVVPLDRTLVPGVGSPNPNGLLGGVDDFFSSEIERPNNPPELGSLEPEIKSPYRFNHMTIYYRVMNYKIRRSCDI